MNNVSGSEGYMQSTNKYERQTVMPRRSGSRGSNTNEMSENSPIVVSEANIILMEMFLRDQVLAQ
jgi:hypothetical protein